MNIRRTLWSIGFLLMLCFSSYAGGQKETKTLSVTVFNAASTTDIIEEAAALFTSETGIEIITNPASSGTLAKQLEQGAEADLYISASGKWMKYTEDLDIVSRDTPFLKNHLVLIAPPDSSMETLSLGPDTPFCELCGTHLSMGDPAHVPAGRYAKEALETLGWYEEVEDKILPAPDVRSAMAVVELGEADLGIVYETDALKSGSVVLLSRFPDDSHSPISYFCALLENSSDEAARFYEFLLSDEAGEIFKKYGFSLSGGEA